MSAGEAHAKVEYNLLFVGDHFFARQLEWKQVKKNTVPYDSQN